MKQTIIGTRYALAIYKIAVEKEKTSEIYEELNAFLETYYGNEDLRNFLNHPLIKKEEKKNLVEKLFGKIFDELTLNLIQYLIDKSRLVQIKSILVEYIKIYYEKNRIVEAEAIFASKPSEVQLQNLIKKLKLRENKEIKLTTKIDKSILGGIIVKIEDRIIDASLKREIETFRNNIKI